MSRKSYHFPNTSNGNKHINSTEINLTYENQKIALTRNDRNSISISQDKKPSSVPKMKRRRLKDLQYRLLLYAFLQLGQG